MYKKVNVIGYISPESVHRLVNYGGNESKGTVPIHAKRSSVSTIEIKFKAPVWFPDEKQKGEK